MPLLSLLEGTEEEIERIVKVNVTANYFVSTQWKTDDSDDKVNWLASFVRRRLAHSCLEWWNVVAVTSFKYHRCRRCIRCPEPLFIRLLSTHVWDISRHWRRSSARRDMAIALSWPRFTLTLCPRGRIWWMRSIYGAINDILNFLANQLLNGPFVLVAFQQYRRKKQLRSSSMHCFAMNSLSPCRE